MAYSWESKEIQDIGSLWAKAKKDGASQSDLDFIQKQAEDLRAKENYSLNNNGNKVYKSPYTTGITDIYNQINNVQPYQSKYGSSLESLINQISGSKFTYDPETDTSLKAAQGQAIKTNLEAMNDRGILNSTVTTDRSAQVASELVPQYENMAYGRYQDNVNNLYKQAEFYNQLDQQGYAKYQDEVNSLYKRADFINNLDTMAFNKYKDQVDQDYNERMLKLDTEQNTLTNKRNEITDAWNRVSQIGYVDNQTSIILGVPVGTPSKEVRENAITRQQQIEDEIRQNAAQKARDDRLFQQEKALIQERANTTETQATPEQAQNYYDLLDVFSGGGNGTYKDDPVKAQNYIIGNRGKIEPLIGTGLYNQLLNDIGNLTSPQAQSEPVDSNLIKQGLDYMTAKISGVGGKETRMYSDDYVRNWIYGLVNGGVLNDSQGEYLEARLGLTP
jgi:hypothetical protein